MEYGNLLNLIPQPMKNIYRKYENLIKKVINAEWSKVFNHTCLKEFLWPTYTKFKNHDPALRNDETTHEYRRYLIQREIKNKTEILKNLTIEEKRLRYELDSFDIDQQLKMKVEDELNNILEFHDTSTKNNILKKLNNLYKGRIFVKNNSAAYINLSDHVLDPDEIEFLNLGLNFHLQPKYDKLTKHVELEVLYQNLLDLEKQNKITIDNNLADQLRSESTKHRCHRKNSIFTPALRNAAHRLRNLDNVIIRRADKSSVYVLLNKSDYYSKINDILSDNSKFKSINCDPTNELKSNANKIITAINAVSDQFKFSKIIGDFQPGYMYGNVKTHKPNNPLRPIISQVTTPTYEIAKTLNRILTPFIPSKYMLKSTDELIHLLKSNECKGIISSLDVESLFTSVPIDETIDIILELAYNNKDTPPPKIPPTLLRQLLQLCTKQLPFKSPQGCMYLQIEGIAMGSPLGPLFANMYMSYLENTIFSNHNSRPHLYARYMDDIFIQTENINELLNIKKLFEQNSVLKFTHELSNNNKLAFLDTLIDISSNSFHTSVYHKPTDGGQCLNAESECTDKYKNSVIQNFLNRAYKISQTWRDFHTEVKHIKQTLINNNYSNNLVDQHINTFINNKLTDPPLSTHKPNNIPIYYKSQYHSNYKTEERIIKNIIKTNVKPIQNNSKVTIVIYYKNPKTCNLVMKNNLSPPVPHHLKTNVVYSFKCPLAHSNVHDYEYIGLTSNSLQHRLQQHTYRGSIKEHFLHDHNITVTKSHLIENTSILTHAENRFKLSIKEALLILQKSPIINKQYDNFSNILKLYKSRNIPIHDNNTHQNNNVTSTSATDEPTISLSLPQHHDNNQSPRLRHEASPQIVHHINELFSNIHNNPSPSPVPSQTRYNLRRRPNLDSLIT